MADISNVDNMTIKDLYERLENLGCTKSLSSLLMANSLTDIPLDLLARIMTRILY